MQRDPDNTVLIAIGVTIAVLMLVCLCVTYANALKNDSKGQPPDCCCIVSCDSSPNHTSGGDCCDCGDCGGGGCDCGGCGVCGCC